MDYAAQALLIQEDFAKCRRLLLALGDENRQGILTVLLSEGKKRGGMRVGEITQMTHLSRPAVSHHIRILLDAGLAQVRHQGTMNFYSVKLGKECQSLFDLVHHIEDVKTAAHTSANFSTEQQ